MPLGDGAMQKTAKVVFAKSVSTRIVNGLLAPLVESVVSDAFAPADVNVVLEPYGSSPTDTSRGVPLDTWTIILFWMNMLFKMLISVF